MLSRRVKSEFVVGAIGDVTRIGALPFLVVQIMLNHPHRHPQILINVAHPFRVTAGQIVVYRDHMNAFGFQAIEVNGKRGDQRLPFAGLHLGNFPLMQNDAADELNVKVAHVESPLSGFAYQSECFRENLHEGGAPAQFLLELAGLGAHLVGRKL